MNSSSRLGILTGIGVIGLTFALLNWGPSLSVESAPVHAPLAATTADGEVVAATPSREGPGEGVTVHGDWRIDVLDPDGSLVSRTEFKNALNSDGALSLARLLGRVASVGEWRVQLLSPGTNGTLCNGSSGQPVSCFIAETSGGNESNWFQGLTVTVPPRGDADEDKMILQGTATVARDGDVAHVRTAFHRACNEGAPPECDTSIGSFQTFSTANLSQIPVQTGQSVMVTVTFSFS